MNRKLATIQIIISVNDDGKLVSDNRVLHSDEMKNMLLAMSKSERAEYERLRGKVIGAAFDFVSYASDPDNQRKRVSRI